MRVTDFDYDLPESLIAQTPLDPRDASRLLVLDRRTGAVTHRLFRDLPELLHPGDCLVLNDSRVLSARLLGRRPTGGRVEVLLLRPLVKDTWAALVKPGRRLPSGSRLFFGPANQPPLLVATVLERRAEGEAVLRFDPPEGGGLLDRIHQLGQMPLPPYIKAMLRDPERYQTVYAREEGSAAAPTAGLHFTPALLESLQARGIALAWVTLHVGLGTFRPVQAENVADHVMHAEYYRLPEAAATAVNAARQRGGRVVAVGTTAARTLETCAEGGAVRAGEGWTRLFITPGYRFQAVDVLLTNFHLPRSTLLMLAAAFAGREAVLAAYREAVRENYRFFSFGDAMLIL